MFHGGDAVLDGDASVPEHTAEFGDSRPMPCSVQSSLQRLARPSPSMHQHLAVDALDRRRHRSRLSGPRSLGQARSQSGSYRRGRHPPRPTCSTPMPLSPHLSPYQSGLHHTYDLHFIVGTDVNDGDRSLERSWPAPRKSPQSSVSYMLPSNVRRTDGRMQYDLTLYVDEAYNAI
jgi:hypothetical protein